MMILSRLIRRMWMILCVSVGLEFDMICLI